MTRKKARTVRTPRFQNTNKTVREEPVGLDAILVSLILLVTFFAMAVKG